jgi:hypothetical protein
MGMGETCYCDDAYLHLDPGGHTYIRADARVYLAEPTHQFAITRTEEGFKLRVRSPYKFFGHMLTGPEPLPTWVEMLPIVEIVDEKGNVHKPDP